MTARQGAENDVVSEIEEFSVVETVDCTPTWEGLVPILLEIYASDPSQRDYVRGQFNRIARLADRINSEGK